MKPFAWTIEKNDDDPFDLDDLPWSEEEDEEQVECVKCGSITWSAGDLTDDFKIINCTDCPTKGEHH